MNQLATELNISNGALTGHIKKLEECGLINISNNLPDTAIKNVFRDAGPHHCGRQETD